MNRQFWEQYPIQPDFHCVEMKESLQAAVLEKIKAMKSPDIVGFYRDGSARFGKDIKKLQSERPGECL